MSEFQTNAMIGRLGLLYGAPDKDREQAKKIITEYARLMAQYSEAELNAAADIVVSRHRFKTWPTIAECIAALEDHRAAVRAKNAPERSKVPFPYPEWSRERIAEADKMIDCFLGRRAAREGWILSMHDFCRNHRRLPTEREIPELISSARFVDRYAAGAMDRVEALQDRADFYDAKPGEPLRADPAAQAALRKLADSMLAKREKLARKVLGEAA